MDDIFKIEIISPDKIIFSSEITEAIIPAFEGLMTILKDHIPLVTFLRPGILEVISSKFNEKFFLTDGTVEFSNNKLLILTASATNIDKMKSEDITNMIRDAEKNISDEKITDKEKYILSYKINTLNEINQ